MIVSGKEIGNSLWSIDFTPDRDGVISVYCNYEVKATRNKSGENDNVWEISTVSLDGYLNGANVYHQNDGHFNTAVMRWDRNYPVQKGVRQVVMVRVSNLWADPVPGTWIFQLEFK